MTPRKPLRHGTPYVYRRYKCRCDACRAAHTADCKAWRRKNGVLDTNGNTCQVGTDVFRTQQEAARASGKAKSTISWHLNKHGNLDRLGGKRGGPAPKLCKPVRVGTREWPSRSALERYLGVASGTVHRWINGNRMDCLLAALLRADEAKKATA